MRLFLLSLIFILCTSVVKAQSFELKVADSSCACLKMAKTVSDSLVTSCISQSMLLVAMDDSTGKYMKQIGTVEGIQGTHKKVRKLLAERCPESLQKPKDN
jgi:hypothetical protein